MSNPKKTVKSAPKVEEGLSEEQKKALQDEMRNNQIMARRAQVAINLLPSIIGAFPQLSEEEMVEKAEKLTEIAMEKLLGVTFTSEKPKN